jgi:Flp pilus assembly protein TadG
MRNGSFHRLLRRFRGDYKGVTALEFALVGPLHIALILGLIESGLLFAKMAMLDFAAAGAAKFVYVGSASGGAVTQEDIEEFVCTRAGMFASDCAENIAVELQPLGDFTDDPGQAATCKDSDLEVQPTVQYTPGSGGSIVLMRLCLSTKVITPGLGVGLALDKTDTGKYQLISAMAFMNEPF